MFSRLVMAGLTTLAITGSGLSKETWQGQIIFTSVSGTECTNDGWNVGSTFTAAFTPSGISDNGPESVLGMHYYNRNAYALKTAGRFAAGKGYTGVAISSRGYQFDFVGGTPTFSTPLIGATTRYLNISGSISDWAGQLGCTVSFDGAFVRRR